MRAYGFATSGRPHPALQYRLVGPELAEPVSRWRAFVAGLWSALLALMLLLVSGCAQLAQPSEAPPSTEPPYALVASRYLASVMTDRSAFEDFEISGLRWVHSLKGWSWLACVHFTDHGHVRSYALFIQNDAVIDGRYAVETDACSSQTYTPFDMEKGTLGRPTAPRQPPIY
jgi:hypothetical protein